MYIFLVLLCFLGCLSRSCVAASITRDSLAVAEEREDNGLWVKRSKLSANTVLPVRIALAQSNLDLGEEYLIRV